MTTLRIFFLFVHLCRGSLYYFDDASAAGRRFDGVGGLSGGGATSKLLVNYPEAQRSEILDYLFKPNYGASLQILKVEIGGDAQSTDGTEASHMHNSWDENYFRGYEWWLMKEAKKRNPGIRLYGLPWAFPGWVAVGTKSPYVNSTLTASYITKWILGAKTHHNLTIDFVGIWNERSYSIAYIKILREVLDKNNLSHVQIVASDGNWRIVDDILNNQDLARAVQFVGVHYPGTLTVPAALKTGKQLWASEDYSTYNDNVGGGCWARILNQNYVNGYMTSTISWNLIASYYPGLPYFRCGLMSAFEPWSGSYQVNAPIWLTAHTTHFAQIGWMYLAHNNGVGHLDGGGSYVSLTDPQGQHQLTIIIETMTHNHSKCIRPALPKYEVIPQNVTFRLKGNFTSIKQLNIWYSKLGFDGAPSTLFKNIGSIQVTNGSLTLALGLDEVYTLTTVSTSYESPQTQPPPSKPFPLPYSEDFEDVPMHAEPNNFAQQTGSFEVAVVEYPYHNVMRQMVLQTPACWCTADLVNASINVIGNINWTDIHVEVETRNHPVNSTDSMFVAARVSQGGCTVFVARGVFFFFYPATGRFEVSLDLARAIVIHKGQVIGVMPTWNKLGLSVMGTQMVGTFNDAVVFDIFSPDVVRNGFAAVGTGSFGIADFDNFRVNNISENPQHLLHQQRRKHQNKNLLYFKGYV